MQKCKGVKGQGANKGEQCTFPVVNFGYCGKHQRNYEHDRLISDKKIPCSNFFRGCNNIVLKKGKCNVCKEKIIKKKTLCAHKECTNGVEETKYCGKHSRDVYFDEEKEKNIKYCDVLRGCLNIVKDIKTCEDCLEKIRKTDNKRRKRRVELHTAIEANKDATIQICVNCGKDYTKFLTRTKTSSKICKICSVNQAKQDEKRKDRKRNYSAEAYNNINAYYTKTLSDAPKRGLSFNLNFDEFNTLVVSKCYYCDYSKDSETNGIDRVDNSLGYETNNCVSCCKICNRMKNFLHPKFFVEICKLISTCTKPVAEFYSEWQEYYGRSNNHSYASYKYLSENLRGIPLKITQTEWDQLTRSACYLCGYQNSKGIGLDRVDNTIREYNMNNIKPCCGTCNNIKSYFSIEVIRAKASLISIKWANKSDFDSIPKGLNPTKNGKITVQKQRIVWKPQGVYYDILSQEDKFYKQYMYKMSDEDYEELEYIVSLCDREEALMSINILLDSLKET